MLFKIQLNCEDRHHELESEDHRGEETGNKAVHYEKAERMAIHQSDEASSHLHEQTSDDQETEAAPVFRLFGLKSTFSDQVGNGDDGDGQEHKSN